MNINSKNKSQLILFISISFILFFFWNTFLIFPIKLFSVLIHEISHGFTALITGGKIILINIDFNLGGNIETENGVDFLVAFAGYIGSLTIGIIFFNYNQNINVIKFTSVLIIFISIIIVANADAETNFYIFTFILILFLTSLIFFIKFSVIQLIVKVLGFISMIYVLLDLRNDFFVEGYVSDAKIISEQFGINFYIISFLWILLTVFVISYFIRKYLNNNLAILHKRED